MSKTYYKIYKDASGSVGIGTTSPTKPLTIRSNSEQLLLETSSSPTTFYATLSSRYDSAHPFALNVANNSSTSIEYFGVYADGGGANNRVAFPSGSVGIGTTSPEGKLHIFSGSAGTVTASSAAGQLVIEGSGDSGLTILSPDNKESNIFLGGPGLSYGGLLRWKHSDLKLTLGTNVSNSFIVFNTGAGTERMRIASNGNVGIGTTHGGKKLNVISAARIWGSTSNATEDYLDIDFYNDNTSVSLVKIGAGTSGGTSNGTLKLYTSNAGTLTEALKIDQNQNVYISGNETQLRFASTDTVGWNVRAFIKTEGRTGTYGYGGDLVFGTRDDGNTLAERARIINNGNFGIGTTSPASLLHISGSGHEALKITAGTSSDAQIHFGDSGDDDIGMINYDNAQNAMKFIVNTAERMRINSDGEVLVGRTSALNTGSKLQVDNAIALGSSLYTFSQVVGGADLQLISNANPANIGVNSNIIFKLGTSGGGGPVERMRIVSDGKIQIGNNIPMWSGAYGGALILRGDNTTTSRYAQLAIVDSTGSVVNDGMKLSTNGDIGLNCDANNYTNKATMSMNGVWGGKIEHLVSGTVKSDWEWSTGGLTVFGTKVSEALQFKTNNTGRVLIDPNGNVKIGSGTANASGKLEIIGNLIINGASNSNVAQQVFTRTDVSWGIFNETNLRIYSSNSNTTSPSTLRFQIASTGAIQFSAYGSGSFTGTSTHYLTVDSSGNVIKELISSGTPTGSGTTNYIPKWNGAVSLTNSAIYEDANGNIGIGITTPVRQLVIYDSTGSEAQMQFQTSATGAADAQGFRVGYNGSGGNIWNFENNYVRIATNNSERMRIDAGGDVGIGTTNPSQKLHVVGKALITDDVQLTGSNPRIDFNTNGASSLRFYDTTNTAERARFNTDGNLGIGTTSPSSTLHVVDGTSGASVLTVDGTNGTLFEVVDDLSGSLMSVNDAAGLPVLEVFADSHIVAGRYGQNDFYLDTNGNLGLGRSNPNYKLHVNGNVAFGGNYASGNDYNLLYTAANSSAQNHEHAFYFPANSTNDSVNWYLNRGNGAYGYWNIDFGGTSRFYIGGSSLANSGHSYIMPYSNLGVGTTTATRKLHVQGEVMINPGTGASTYNDLSIGGINGLSNGEAHRINFVYGGNGNFIFSTIESYFNNNNVGASKLRFRNLYNGSSNTDISMTILGNGNVGIGSDQPTQKLVVAGSTSVNENNTLITAQGDFTGTHGFGIGVRRDADTGTNALALGADSSNNGLIASNASQLKIGRTVSSSFYTSLVIDNNNDIIIHSDDVLPSADVSTNLGSTAYRFLATYTAKLLAGDGSVSAPGITFINDTNTGLYRPANDYLSFATGGVSRMTMFSSGVQIDKDSLGMLYQPLESSSYGARFFLMFDYTNNASYPFLTNRTPSGKVVIKTGVAAGGGENTHFTIEGGNGTVDAYFENANLGIGTTGPRSALDVHEASDSTLRTSRYTSNGIKLIASDSNNSMIRLAFDAYLYDFRDGNNNPRLYIEAGSGNVGIGSASPTEKLFVLHGTINSTIARFTGANANRGLVIGTAVSGITNDSIIEYDAVSTNSVGQHAFKTDGTERVRISADGNVGVGTTSPTSKLNVYSSTAGASIFSADGTSGRVFEITDDISTSLMSVNTIAGLPAFEVFADYHIVAGRYNQNDFYLDTNGNLGLGTASPTFKLDVAGDARINDSGAANGTASQTMQVVNTTAGATSSYIYIGASSGTDWKVGKNILGTLSRTNFDIATHANVFGLTINTSGSVGVGLSDPGSYALNVEHPAGGAMRVGQSGGIGLDIGHTAFSASNAYTGIKNTDWTGTADYALIVGTADTYLSAKSGGTLHLRGGGNQGNGGVYIYGDGSVVVNEGQGNADFRVEGDTATHLLFTDASADRVGIGVSIPSYLLDVAGDAAATTFVGKVTTGTNGAANDPFRLEYDTTSWLIGAAPSASSGNITWGLFWAGNSGAAYGTNGNGGPGDIWSNSGNPNEFVFVGANSTKWTVYGNTGDTWQAGGALVTGSVGIGTNTPSEKLHLNAGSFRISGDKGIGVDGGSTHVPVVGGGSFVTSSQYQTGYLKITLPQSWTSTMLQFVVDVYEYASGFAKSFTLAGYNYDGSTDYWVNTSAYVVSDSDTNEYTVKFGHDGTYCAVYIEKPAGASSQWDFPQVRVRDFFAGYNNYGVDKWVDSWNVGFTTSLGTITSTRTCGGGGNINGSGAANKVAFWTDENTLSNNTNFHWDNTNERLGIGTPSPSQKLQVNDGHIYIGTSANKFLVSNGYSYFRDYSTYGGYLGRISIISMNNAANSWDDYAYHGIGSTDASGNFADSISINSYNDITLRLDSNNNNSASYFRIMNNTTGNNIISYIGFDGTYSTAQLPSFVGVNAGPSLSYNLYVNGSLGISGQNTYWLYAGDAYLRCDNEFRFLTTTGSAQRGRFKSIQVSTTYGGTPPDNGILFYNDTTLTRTAAYTLTANTSAFVIDSASGDGVLKIYGSASAYDGVIELLNESGASTEGFRIRYDNDVGDTYFDNIWSSGSNANPAIRFRTKTYSATVDAMTITHGGNVGIGTTSPDSKFQVGAGTSNSYSTVAQLSGDSGGASVLSALSLVNSRTAATGNGVAIDFHTANNYSPTARIATVTTGAGGVANADLRFYTYNGGLAQQMVLDRAGNLGIGTVSPTNGKLVVAGNGVVTGDLMVGRDATTTLYAAGQTTFSETSLCVDGGSDSVVGIRMTALRTSGASSYEIWADSTALHFDTMNNGRDFVFNSQGGSSDVANQVWIMNPNGEVGIGDSAPDAKLHVQTSGGSTTSENVVAIFQADTSSAILGGGGTAIKFRGVSSGGNIQNYDQAMISSYGYSSNNSHGLAFYTKPNAATALTMGLFISSNLNVGIGTTSPAQKLAVMGSIYMPAGQVLTWSNGDADIYSSGYSLIFRTYDGSSNSEKMRILGNGNVGIGTASPGYKLQVNGSFAATTKSFDIAHPTKEGKRLVYASLEGPENGVYVRGRQNTFIIELPDYWVGLVHEDSITVNLTSIGRDEEGNVRNYSVDDIKDNKVFVYTDSPDKIYNYFYTINGERKDVDKLEVEKEEV